MTEVGFIAVAELVSTEAGKKHIIAIQVDEEVQGMGLGRQMMDIITGSADANEETLTLYVSVPVGAPPMRADHLREWFETFGFVSIDEDEPFRMARGPVKAKEEKEEKSLSNA